ncbi:unnamed protein product [Pocillopora meandrina]|uniref:Uncharacterized protein n=1 Tax=Pocillopora meandrina TaxID=46732 RepID=A0AAU9XH87_9CNID|nr:unnamed protein product [Pocillopora meandrina]
MADNLKLDFTQTLCYPSFEQPSPGLFGISNCGFGGRTITEEPQEKSSRQKKEYTSTMMACLEFQIMVLVERQELKNPKKKSPRQKREYTCMVIEIISHSGIAIDSNQNRLYDAQSAG